MSTFALIASVSLAMAPFLLFAGLPRSVRAIQPPTRPIPHPHPRLPIQPVPPRPVHQIAVKAVEVDATIRDGVARTDVTHTLENRTGTDQEADFLFPIPAGAEVTSFALYDGDRKMEGRLLNRDEATATYEEIVRRRRDPALLTFQGRAALRARVFPIAANSQRKITLKLVSVLPKEGNARKYVWTLVGPHLPGAARPEKVSVRVAVAGSGIGSVYSPTHEMDFRRSESEVTAVWESAGSDSRLAENPELNLFVAGKSEEAVALSVLTYNAALPQVASLTGGVRQSGYFLVVVSPTLSATERNPAPRRVVLVMDRSGSMQGKKIEQAKGALRFAIGKLRPQDRFNILTFSDAVEPFAPEPIHATPDNKKRAEAFVDGITADGGTNINQALLDGLKQFPERASGNTLLFFTDGLPTVGERSQATIVRNAVQENAKKARTFVFGVGYDVDVPFLDQVSQSLRGDADYVRPDEDIEVKTSRFVARTNATVLENLKLTVDGARTGEIYPRPGDLPDLFSGGQLVIVGRYTGGSEKVRLTLAGEANGRPQSFDLTAKFPAVETGADFLPRLWASRKIGYLMDEVRLRTDDDTRKEVIDQIIALSKEYGILTPYTGLFVPEPETVGTSLSTSLGRGTVGLPAGAAPGGVGVGGGGNAGGRTDVRFGSADTGRKGESAVNLSQATRAQRNQAVVGNTSYYRAQAGEDKDRNARMAERIRNAGSRAFYRTGNGDVWQDATYDAKKQKEIVRIKVYSPAYFALIRRNRDIARWASVGETVLFVANATQAVRFGTDGKETLTAAEVTALAGK
ncbi:MAG: VIT domain-containing protein [Capsulimonadales bacterium]|nr:VIT domain-containing protein [Capsulimonadales bacterium]